MQRGVHRHRSQRELRARDAHALSAMTRGRHVLHAVFSTAAQRRRGVQALIGDGTVCLEALVSQGGREVAVECVSPLHSVARADGSHASDGQSKLREALIRRCGVDVVHVNIVGKRWEDLESEHFLGRIKGQLREAGLTV